MSLGRHRHCVGQHSTHHSKCGPLYAHQSWAHKNYIKIVWWLYQPIVADGLHVGSS